MTRDIKRHSPSSPVYPAHGYRFRRPLKLKIKAATTDWELRPSQPVVAAYQVNVTQELQGPRYKIPPLSLHFRVPNSLPLPELPSNVFETLVKFPLGGRLGSRQRAPGERQALPRLTLASL